jgi:hypothetical protein
MKSQTLTFDSDGPYILNTALASVNKSYGNTSLSQKGGNKKKKVDVTKQFMFQLLKLATDLKTSKENSLSSCYTTLKPFITDDFKYNKIIGDKGLSLICRHMRELKEAFPVMNLSVTHFKDTDKHSSVVVLLVLGVMKGNWLNHSASGKYERLGIVFHLLSEKGRKRIKEITFKSEFISEECYKKIRALDLLHTAFAINKSIEEAKENKNKFVKQSETVDVPLILTHVDNQPAEEDDFEKQIEEAEIIMFGNNKKNNQRVIPENKFSRNEPVGEVNFIQENEPVDEESELPEEVEEVEEVDVEEENEPEEILIEDPGNESENIINVEQVSNNTSQVINPSNFTGENIDPTNFRRMIEESELEEQNGGDGYYTAVEKLPIAGRPVIRGYKSCCQPYFRTDGQEFDHLCQMGGMGNHVSLNSKTLLMVKNGVIYSITASVIDSIGENTAKMMGMKGVHKKQIKDHMKQHMHNHTYNVVKEMVTNGSNALSGVIPQNDFMFSLVPVRTHFSQHGGNYIGTLGTLLFPSGNPAGNIVPWLLTLGSVLFKRIERDIYKISHKLGKKKVTRKPSKIFQEKSN